MMDQFNVGDVLMHKQTGITGFYLKCYIPTGSQLTLQIQCYDGRIFYAPYIEFLKVS